MLRIRIRSDLKLFAGCGVGKNHSGSGQHGPGMKMKQNFSDKIHNISTKCTIKKKFLNFPKKLKVRRRLVYILNKYINCRNFGNKVRVYRAISLKDPEPKRPEKSDPDQDPKKIIPDPQPC